jgi:hypothetical protein
MKIIYSTASHEIIATSEDVADDSELTQLAEYILTEYDAPAEDFQTLKTATASAALIEALHTRKAFMPMPAFKVIAGAAVLA